MAIEPTIHFMTDAEIAEMDRNVMLMLDGDRRRVTMKGAPIRALLQHTDFEGDGLVIIWGQDGLTVCGNADEQACPLKTVKDTDHE